METADEIELDEDGIWALCADGSGLESGSAGKRSPASSFDRDGGGASGATDSESDRLLAHRGAVARRE